MWKTFIKYLQINIVTPKMPVENPVHKAVEKTRPPVDNFIRREFSAISTGQIFRSLWKCG
jgi:hypothetical protein